MAESHPALIKTSSFEINKKEQKVNNLLKNGFIILKNSISIDHCNQLICDLNFLRNKPPYYLKDKNSYAGVFRSPFIFFESYRKLLFLSQFHRILHQSFPTNYQLHLSRCVENKPNKIAATIEWHRDIPYLHTPSKFPLSISFLTFLSNSEEVQIEIKLNSHNEFFYNYHEAELLRLNPKPGDTLVFDSNLIHRTLPTNKTVLYNLYMFSTPILKPVVNYSSPEILSEIDKNKYKLDHLHKILAHEYLVPRDDTEYIDRH